MESKKINQLATELAPDLSDLTIIGDPTTGISKKITLSQMASLFTGTVEEYANLAAFPLVGVADTIYIALDTNVIYRYDTSLSAYVILSPNIINSLVFSDANGFDGTITLVGSVATLSITTALTLGSVPFIGASGALTQDNSNLFFDDTNNRLGIGTASPTTPLDVFGSGIIGRLNATSTNNAYLGFASNGTNKWSAGNVQSDHRFRIFSEANSAELITILQTGEFGIGISNPTTKFHIDGAATALIANLDANVSVAKSVSFRSDNSSRINLEVSGTESGSNAGADFFLRTFTDAGSLLETPFTIVRSTGVTTIKSLTLTNVLSVANGGTGSATQNFVDLTTTQSIGGAKTFTSAATFSSKITTATLSTIGTAVAATNVQLNLNGVTGKAQRIEFQHSGVQQWLIGCGASSETNAFEIFNSTGVNSLEINKSTNAVTFAGQIKTTFSGQSISINATGTGSVRMQLQNNNIGNAGVTVESSTGGDQFSGTSAYSMAIGTYTARDFHIGTNGVTRLTVTSGGDVQFTKVGDNLYTKSDGTNFARTIFSGGNINCFFPGGTTANNGRWGINNYEDNAALLRVYNNGLINTGTSASSPYNNTTGASANMHVSSDGTIYRSTSSIRFKTQIEDLTIDTSNILSKMRPIWYRSLGKNDKKDWSWYGFIAEELAEFEPRLVHWGYDLSQYETIEIEDEEGNIKKETKLKDNEQLIPDGIQYERITVLLVAELQKMRKELDALKAK